MTGRSGTQASPNLPDPSVVDQPEQGRKGVSCLRRSWRVPSNRTRFDGRLLDLRDPNSGAYPNGLTIRTHRKRTPRSYAGSSPGASPTSFNKTASWGAAATPSPTPVT